MAAAKDLLERIHEKLAQDMLERLEGEESMTAAEWGAVIKFLQNNGIDAHVGGDKAAASAFAKLVEAAQKSASVHLTRQ